MAKFYDFSTKIINFISELYPLDGVTTLTADNIDQVLVSCSEEARPILRYILEGTKVPSGNEIHHLQNLQKYIKEQLQATSLEQSKILIETHRRIQELLNPRSTAKEALLSEITSNIIAEAKKEALVTLINEAALITTVTYGDSDVVNRLRSAFHGKYDENEYKKILIYTKCAYIFERNGIAEEHALKLTIIFKTFNIAMNYIHGFAMETVRIDKGEQARRIETDSQIVHDCCLFGLPSPDINWKKWRTLFTPVNLLNKKFRKLLPFAKKIETLIPSRSNGELDRSAIDRHLTALTSLQADFIKLHKHRDNLDGDQKKRYTDLLLSISNIEIELSNLFSVKGFNNVSVNELLYHFERYKSEASPSYKFFLNHGIPDDKHELFLTLDRSIAGQNIPPLTIYGDSIGLPQYYMRKLNVQEEHDGAIAACLGKMTNCCQSLSGEAGEECVIHGLTSPNGGFYILCQKPSATAAPNHATDKIIAQSWVWRSTDGGLVFDSAEYDRFQIEADGIKSFYTRAAQELSQKYGIPNIFIGLDGGTPYKIGIHEAEITGKPIDYNGYRDSYEQSVLISKLVLYLKQDDGITCDERKTLATTMLKNKLSLAISPKELAADKFMRVLANVAWRQTWRKNVVVQLVLGQYFHSLTETDLQQKFNRFMVANEALYNEIKTPCDGTKIIEALETGAVINLRNRNGNTILHVANLELLNATLAYHAPEERLSALQVQNNAGENVFHVAATNSDVAIINAIFAICPPDRYLNILSCRTNSGETVFHKAATNPNLEIINAILALCPPEKYLNLLSDRTNAGETVLHKAVTNPNLEMAELILGLHPQAKRLAAIKATTHQGKTALSCASANNPLLLVVIFELLSIADRSAVLSEKSLRISLHEAITKFSAEALDTLLKLFSQEELRVVLRDKTWKGTGLNEVACNRNPKAMNTLLAVFPLKERLAVIWEENEFGSSVWESAVYQNNHQVIIGILESFPATERWQIVRKKIRNFGESILIGITREKHELLLDILALLPATDRSSALKEKSIHGATFLHCAMREITGGLLRSLLRFFEPEELKVTLQEKNTEGETLLHLAAMNSDAEVMQIILELHRPDEHFAVVTDQDKYGRDVLHKAARGNVQSLITLLKLYPSEDHLAVILHQGEDGENLLHRASGNPLSLEALLKFFPSEQRLGVLKIESKDLGNVLQIAAYQNFESTVMILKLHPPEQRLTALIEKNLSGTSAVQRLAFSHMESCNAILELLPISDRVTVLLHVIDKYGEQFIDRARDKNCLQPILQCLELSQVEELINHPALHSWTQSSIKCHVASMVKLPVIHVRDQRLKVEEMRAIASLNSHFDDLLFHNIKIPN